MRKMTYQDLTPELLMELAACASAEELISACARKELEISASGAASLMEKLKKARELGMEHLSKVAGGQKGYGGTRKLSSDNCFDGNGNGIDDEIDAENGQMLKAVNWIESEQTKEKEILLR